MSPIAATSPAATVTFTPAIVSSRLHGRVVDDGLARSRDRARRGPRRAGRARAGAASIAARSSSGRACRASQARPGPLNSSACGHGGTRWAARIAWISFFTRVRWRTTWLRRATSRRRRSVSASGTHTSGRKPAARSDASTPASILSVLIVGMGDRLHLQRIGDDHARHVGAQHAHHRHGVAGGLDHHLVVLGQAAAEALEPRAGHVDPAVPAQPAVLPEHHLGEGAVDVHADHAPHPMPSVHGHGSGGRHDNYGSALAAQPGGSQGRPATNTSSQLIVCIGLPTLHAPSAPHPGWSHHTRGSADPRRARRHQEHHAGYEPARAAEQGDQAAGRRGRHLPERGGHRPPGRCPDARADDEWAVSRRYFSLESLASLADTDAAKLPAVAA